MRKGRDGQSKLAIFPQFLTSNEIRAKGLRGDTLNRNFSSVFDVQRPFRAKGLPRDKLNRNFSSVFDVQRPFRAKGLRFVAFRRHRPRLKRE